MNRIGSWVGAAAALLIGAPAALGEPAFIRPTGTADIQEVAPGYAALFTCSAHFIMGRPLQDILRVELIDLRALDLPPPEIDEVRQLVRAQNQAGRQAVAVYRDSMGCTILPPTWQEADAGRLPYVSYPPPPEVSDVPFPAGDAADPRPDGRQRALLQAAFDSATYGDDTVTVGVVVLKDGAIVGERYRPGFDKHTGYRTWSTAKSITATLIGIAQRDGIVELDAPANVPEWQYLDDPRQRITLRHLLHMSSGLRSAGASTEAVYFGGQDAVSAITTTAPEAPPNTRWKYANADTLLLLHALRTSLNNDLRYFRYPYDELFHKLGMFHSRLEMDHAGNFIGSSQMYTTARDLARFGQLYLQQGEWQGQQILPRGWTEFVAEAAPALPREDGKQGYGAQFWLLDRLPGIPPGTYTTAGNKGQHATIVPRHNMVVVRTGVDPNGIRWRHDRFVADVIDAFD